MDIGDTGGYAYMWDAATAVTAAIDLWEIVPSTGSNYRVGGLSLSQTTDLGDAAHEILNFQYVLGNTTGGFGGGTPVSYGIGSGAGMSIDSAECRNTTQASGGTPDKGPMQGWNVLHPVDFWYPNGLEPRLEYDYDASGRKNVVRLLAAPADSLTIISTIWLRAGNVN